MRSTRFFFGLLVLAVAGCARGGGGSQAVKGGSGEPGLNEGVFSASEFSYADPYPPTFHPLGEPFFTIIRTDEVAFLVADTGESWVRDDVEENYDTSGVLPPEANGDMTVIDSASGDVDGDGGPELVLIGSFDPGDGTKHLQVRILTGGPNGWSVLGVFAIGNAGEDYLVGRVRVGDVDGDLRDEIVVAATHDVDQSWVRVFEDPIEAGGYGVFRDGFDFPGRDEVRAAPAQLDVDLARELVIVVSGGSSAIAPVLDDALTGYATLEADLFSNTRNSPAGLYSSDADSVDLLVGNFDDDPRQEIAVYTMQAVDKWRLWHEFFDDFEGGLRSLESLEGVVQGFWSSYDPARLRRGRAGDLDGNGVDEAIWLWTDPDRVLGTYVFDPMDDFGGSNLGSIPGKDWLAWDLAVIDDDTDGRFEVVIAGIDDTGTCCWSAVERQPGGAEVEYESGSRSVSSMASLVLVGDDFERDGTRVRWTGDKKEHLPNPIPLLVAVAPPTKSGISQNFDASEASYSTAEGEEYAYESSLTESASASLGLEIEDICGTFGMMFKATLKAEVETTTGGSNSTVRTVEFTGSHDHDVVIFQGTLHKTYEYEIVHAKNPDAIGTRMTINTPLETKVYKWTLELFEERFGKDTILPAGLLSHTIGAPDSYPTRDEALALLKTYEGFEGDLVTIGQGRGSNGCEVALANEDVSSFGWKTGFELEGELKLGGLTLGASYGLEEGGLHESTTSTGTTYRGVIGDIADSTEYFDWAYDAGIFVYAWTGNDDEPPVQVLNFWVDPWGHQY